MLLRYRSGSLDQLVSQLDHAAVESVGVAFEHSPDGEFKLELHPWPTQLDELAWTAVGRQSVAQRADVLGQVGPEQGDLVVGHFLVGLLGMVVVVPAVQRPRVAELTAGRSRCANVTAFTADLTAKPVSVFTFKEVRDHTRVLAHLSEPIPIRFDQDYSDHMDLVRTELINGLMPKLEAQIIGGNGTGER